MVSVKELKPESDAIYRLNIWFYKLTGSIWNPRRRLKKIPLEEGMTVLDYGCGPGRYTLPVTRLVGLEGKVFAVDIQSLAISTTKEKAARESLANIEPILIDSYNTGIQNSSIDLALLLDTLHQIGDCNALFLEIHRVLKEDGVLFMDSGRTKMARAREIVENTGLFTIAECQGHDMLVVPKAKQ